MLSHELSKCFLVYVFIKICMDLYKKNLSFLLSIIGSKYISLYDLRKSNRFFEDYGKRKMGK